MSKRICLDCANLDLRGDVRMAECGFGHCRSDGVGVFKSVAIMRHCDRFTEAKGDVRTARNDWMSTRIAGWQQKQAD